GDVVDDRDRRQRLRAQRPVLLRGVDEMRAPGAAVLVSHRGAGPLVALVVVVVAGVGRVVLPVVAGLPIAAHAANRRADALVLLRVDAVDVGADRPDHLPGVDLEGQVAGLDGRRVGGVLV